MRRRSLSKFVCIAIALFLFVGTARADTILLKNGRNLQGIIRDESDDSVELDMGGGSVRIDKNTIRRIKRSASAEAEEMKAGFDRKQSEMEKRREEFTEERNRRFSEFAKWKDEENAKNRSQSGEPGQIQASRDPMSDGIIVETIINDKVKTVLLVDTGATDVMLSRKIAGELGIDLTDTKREVVDVTVADGRRVKAKCVILKSLSVQGVEEKDVRALIPLEEISSISLHNGLLGMSYLGRFNISIDRASMKIGLERIGKKK